MKLLNILIGLLISNSIFSQIDEWNNAIIMSNMISNVTIYMKAPPTNPDRDQEELIKFQKINFNKKGYITNDTCFNCSISFAGENSSARNSIKEYKYDNLKLTIEKDISFDTIVYNYKYDRINKNIIVKYGIDDLNNIISITTILKNKSNLIQKQIEFNFENSEFYGDSICAGCFTVLDYDYSKTDTIIARQKKYTLETICLDKNTFESIINSDDNTFLFKTLNDLSPKYSNYTDTTYYIFDENKNLIKILESNNFNTVYSYDKNNLIKSKTTESLNLKENLDLELDYKIEYIYKYEKY